MNDGDLFAKGLSHFEKGEYKQSYIILKILADKYKSVQQNKLNVSFLLQLFLQNCQDYQFLRCHQLNVQLLMSLKEISS